MGSLSDMQSLLLSPNCLSCNFVNGSQDSSLLSVLPGTSSTVSTNYGMVIGTQSMGINFSQTSNQTTVISSPYISVLNGLAIGSLSMSPGYLYSPLGSISNLICSTISVSSISGTSTVFNQGYISTFTSAIGTITTLSCLNIGVQSLTGTTMMLTSAQISTLTTLYASVSNQISTSTLTSNLCRLPNSLFTGLYAELSNLPFLSIYNGTNSSMTNVKLWTGLGSTSGGTVMFFPTSNATNTGNPILNTVLYADASCWVNTTNANSVCNIAGKVIGTNNGSITFNVTMGSNVAGGLGGGGAATTFAPNNTPVMALMIGV